MPEIRKWIIALAVIALFAGMASAQVGIPNPIPEVANQNAGNCSTSEGSVTPTLRSEGYTELTGDILITCTGGPTAALGSLIPVTNIILFYSSNVTSRLLQATTFGSASEGLLLIDEPLSGLAGYGPSVAETLCSNPQTGAGSGGCQEWVGQTTASAALTYPLYVPVNSSPDTGGGGSYVAQNLAPGANIFQGVVSGQAMTFFGIPALAPATQGLSRVLRITNVRINAGGIAGGSSSVIPVTASVSTNGSTSLPIGNAQVVVAFVEPSLVTSLRNAGNTGGGGGTFNQCSSANLSSAAGELQFSENFPNAFKIVCVAGAQCNPGSGSVPGTIYYAEAGFTLAAGAYTNTGLAVTYKPGNADYGTRLKATFSNVPSGVNIFVSTTDVQNSFQPLSALGTSPHAQLVVSEVSTDLSNGASGTVASVPFLNQTATVTGAFGSGTQLIGIDQVNLLSGTGEAVWEVINTNPNTIVSYDFAVYVSYTASPANNTPSAPSSMQVTMSYAPTPSGGAFTATAGSQASNSLTLPRFSDVYDKTFTLASFVLCQTDLLFPYTANVAGFDTGLAIANTTSDPFGTTAQVGTCALNFYGAGAPATPFTTPSVANGTVWTGMLSSIASGFQGYIIAVCNFQLAHGYSFVSDVGVRNFAAAYLALIINNGSLSRGGAASGENLNN